MEPIFRTQSTRCHNFLLETFETKDFIKWINSNGDSDFIKPLVVNSLRNNMLGLDILGQARAHVSKQTMCTTVIG